MRSLRILLTPGLLIAASVAASCGEGLILTPAPPPALTTSSADAGTSPRGDAGLALSCAPGAECRCQPGATRPCYGGDPAEVGRGRCTAGVQRCELAPNSGDDFDNGRWSAACDGEVRPIAEVACDGVDDDCDGVPDDGTSCPACSAGQTRACYSGPAGTAGRGICREGHQSCTSMAGGYGWDSCLDEVLPRAEICANGRDDDCDGSADEDCACTGGQSRACYPGPANEAGVGICRAGAQACKPDGTGWEACSGAVTPAAEICGNGADENCDGVADDRCVCAAGATRPCYGGPAGTAGAGICRNGSEQCLPDGSGWGACSGDVRPAQERCGNGADDDCDSTVDEGCVCTAGSRQPCYRGPPGTAGHGICRNGSQECLPDGSGYGACTGDVGPATDTCGNGVDEDCDGAADDGCVCTPGQQRSCYGGPAGTAGRGICRSGTQTCAADGRSWGGCAGEQQPRSEVCGNGVDENCDGSDPACPPVEIPLFLIGDCVTAVCPAATPYPVACNVIFSPGDDRGCVANAPNSRVVFFKAGNQCDAGLVVGSLYCSERPGSPLGPTNCPINKPQPMWVTSSTQCPR